MDGDGDGEKWSVRKVRSGWEGREWASANGLVFSEGNGCGMDAEKGSRRQEVSVGRGRG